MAKQKSLKDMLQIDSIEGAKIRSNVLFGCHKCKFEWSESDYINVKEYYEGEKCPQCGSKNTCPI